MITITKSASGGTLVITGLADKERILTSSGIFEINDSDEFILTSQAMSNGKTKSYNIGIYTNVNGFVSKAALLEFLGSFFGKVLGGGLTQIDLTNAESPYSITSTTPNIINCDTSGGDVTIIPLSAALGIYKIYTIEKLSSDSANRVIINPPGAEQIQGENTLSILKQFQSYTIASDGIKYNVLSSNIRNIIQMELGAAVGGATPPTAFENTGAGFNYSFSASAINTLMFNENIPRGYNGEDLTFEFDFQLNGTAPIGGDAIRLETTYLVIDETQGTNVIGAAGTTLTETFDVSALNADQRYTRQFTTKFTGKLRGQYVFVKLQRLGADGADTYGDTFDVIGGRLVY